MTKKFKTIAIADIKVQPEINRYEANENTILILNNVKFAVFGNDGIKTNHIPKGLYISADSIVEYIKRNLFGHDKDKYGITEKVE